MDSRALAMGLAFALMWSSAFTSARIIVVEAPPLLSLTLRFLISGLLAIAIALALGQNWRLPRSQWVAVVVFGFCQNAIYLGLNFLAMQTVEASLAAIIASSMPILVAAAGWGITGERLSLPGMAGIVAGFAGVALIMSGRMTSQEPSPDIIMCVIAVVALTVATLVMRNASSGGDRLLMVIGLQMLVGSAALAPLGLALESWNVSWTPRLIAAFTYTTLVPGLLATFVWFMLVDRIGATRAATFHFLNPFLGVAIAAVLLGEALVLRDAVGVAVITVGILAVQVSKQNR